jgi:TRAP-type C4-dicarboxylate transport system permease small subunit
MLAALSRFLSRMALYVSAIGLLGMTLIIAWQVLARYALNAAPSWTEQAALLLMLWFILFAAAAGVREGFHIRLTLFEQALAQRRRRALRLACHAVVALFGLAMAWSGAGLVAETWEHVIPTLGLPRGLSYVPIAGAGALMAFFAVEAMIAEARGRNVARAWS